MSEIALVERIAARAALRDGTSLGIGDDAAVVATGGEAVVTHDMLVEDVHFRRATTGMRDLGAKALAVNLSDLAAMGAVPVAATVGLGVPAWLRDAEADELYAGLEEMAARHGVTVAGGDVTGAPVLVLAVTAIGRALDDVPPVRRSGAAEGDLLCVTGALGAAAAGLLLLEDPTLLPDLAQRPALVAAHRRPAPRVAEGQALARAGASAMMDVSDGLALDARRLAVASGLRARIRLDAVPPARGVREVAAATGTSPHLLAATGGEDYELLVAITAERAARLRESGPRLVVVGGLIEGEPGVELVDADGRPVAPARLGWEHGA
ncbi:thiamine-phosphate kinase [Miltoncostaea marina]|uniref:thiamine-phosphate kinase n=1 Tax=Miltoncostaea marina TaxID=2843215 RepID=UPI001C3DC82C|nr:thiamine-phosphate kinase [Miltoncostaea marina]